MRVPLRMASGGEQAARTRQAQQPIKAARTASANVRAVVLVAFGMASITCLWDNGGSRSGFQNVDKPCRALFWVSPMQKLEALFNQLHNLTDPAEVVRISALHEVDFLPPEAND